jgi:hypothetical protein
MVGGQMVGGGLAAAAIWGGFDVRRPAFVEEDVQLGGFSAGGQPGRGGFANGEVRFGTGDHVQRADDHVGSHDGLLLVVSVCA